MPLLVLVPELVGIIELVLMLDPVLPPVDIEALVDCVPDDAPPPPVPTLMWSSEQETSASPARSVKIGRVRTVMLQWCPHAVNTAHLSLARYVRD